MKTSVAPVVVKSTRRVPGRGTPATVMAKVASVSEVGATYSSTFIAPDGTPSTKVTCSDAGNPAQTAPAYVDGMGLPVNLNGVVTLI